MREAAKRLRDGGRIVNFSTSVVGTRIETYGIYAATKAAIETMTSVLAKELRGRSITVNAVAPGYIDTELTRGISAEAKKYLMDNPDVADNVEAQVLPENKLDIVKKTQANNTKKVLFVGDGINDAPALTQADIGVAMGNGTDIAMESGDIVVMEGDLENVVAAVQFSKKVMRRIKENIFWAFAYNTILIPIAAGVLYPTFGITFEPALAGLAMALSSVTVISLSLMLKRYVPEIKRVKN
jgi:magnesium-transporting ATPase (P-type)